MYLMTHTPPPIFDPLRIQPLTHTQMWQLMQDLPNDRVKQRQGLSYVEAWDVKATLTRVFGFGGFSTQILSEGEVFRLEVPRQNGNGVNWSIGYRVALRLIVPQLGAYWDESAVGSNSQGSIAEAYDNAVKGATSDALKRCATMLGTQFGLSLYDNGNKNEVIKTIVAPGQEWHKGGRPRPKSEQRPDTAAGSVEHVRGEDVTDEEHAARMANLNSALSAATSKPREQRAAEYQHRAGNDVPAALDPSLDPDADLTNPMDASEGIPIR